MYCPNCGMKLPDWAHFCERCGARVGESHVAEDPIDRVGLDDTSVNEPLWPSDKSATADDKRDDAVDPALAQMAGLETELMEPTGNLAALEDEVPTDAEAESLSDAADDPAADEDALPEDEAADVAEDLDDQAEVFEAGDTQMMDAADLAEQSEAAEDVVTEDEAPDATEDEAAADTTEDETADEPDADAEAQVEAADAPDIVDAPDADPTDPAPEEDEVDPDDVAPTMLPYWRGGAFDSAYEGGLIDNQDADDSDQPRTVGMHSAVRHRTNEELFRRQQRAGNYDKKSARYSMLIPLAIAAVALVVGYFLLNTLITMATSSDPTIEQAATTNAKRISKRKARELIATLDGWYNTGRTFDGRFWHIEDGVIYTYAADGQMVHEETIAEDSVEHMDAGPGGIEGAGHYFRSVGFYQLDDDTDMLYAINQDGSYNEDANLHRTEEPNFDEVLAAEEEKEEDPNAGDFILPDSSTRIYDRAELEHLSNYDLWIAYNEIYARAGYKFNPEGELGKRFYAMSWYQPRDDFQWEDFNEVERENTNTMYALEQERGSEYL